MSDFAVSLGHESNRASPAFVRWSRVPVTVAPIVGVADASLYYRDELRRRAGLAAPAAIGDSETLLLSAVAALGPTAIPLLEGDFAFAAWDATSASFLAARDFASKRTLFYAHIAGRLHVATRLADLLADGSVPRALDLATLATVGAGLWAHASNTAYRDIFELPAGHSLHWRPGQSPTVRTSWQAPAATASRRAPLGEAAAELRALLADAVRERLDPVGRTAVSLSGGWDSTAVYATAQSVLGAERGSRAIHGVSISYPEGDPGREDEFIADVTAHWQASPDFIDVEGIPLSVDWPAEAARREQPFAHAYEHWNRALSRRALASGARVILDGIGGDQLFQSSDIYLADLLRTRQWGELSGQWRARRRSGLSARALFRWALRPNLSPRAVQFISRVRRAPPPPHYLDRGASAWFRRDFLRAHDVFERERAARPELPRDSFVLAESQAFLRFPFYPRITSHLARFAREEGLELRSPLLDARIVRFAVARPWSDRVDGTETKRLLRHAMQGLLPDSVLAPRPHRTGTTNAYFLRKLRTTGWPVMERLLPDLRLAELGMVDPTILRRAWEHLLHHDDDELAVRAYFTLQAELWVRARGD